MSPIARIFVTPLAVAVVALVGNAALAAQDATVRHDYRLAALAVVVGTAVRAVAKTTSVLWARRKRPSLPAIPYRTPTRPQARLSSPGYRQLDF